MRLVNLGGNQHALQFLDPAVFNDHVAIEVLFSYETPVAFWLPNRTTHPRPEFFVTDNSISKSTAKHIRAWLEDRGGSGRQVMRPLDFFARLLTGPCSLRDVKEIDQALFEQSSS